jgi:hypothetical protein
MIAATSSFAGVQVTKAVAAPKASGRSALVVEARRTKASAPSRSAAKVRCRISQNRSTRGVKEREPMLADRPRARHAKPVIR